MGRRGMEISGGDAQMVFIGREPDGADGFQWIARLQGLKNVRCVYACALLARLTSYVLCLFVLHLMCVLS